MKTDRSAYEYQCMAACFSSERSKPLVEGQLAVEEKAGPVRKPAGQMNYSVIF